MKLDLGAGAVSPEDYVPVGREHGTEIFPLAYEDASADIIRASHVLEHFGLRQLKDVVTDWVRVLKPGGVLRIAVPDFTQVAAAYLEGSGVGFRADQVIMGGQQDENDFHKSLFDRDNLRALLAECGLVLLRPWKSELDDCANYSFSLNIEGTKPAVSEMKVNAVMSIPRLAFTDTMFCAVEAFLPLHIKLSRHGGAFWGQSLTKAIEKAIEDDAPDAILTLDYDSVFTKSHVARLIETLMAHPEADALASFQSNRHLPTPLFTIKDENGVPQSRLPLKEFEPDIRRISSAHFGLTLIRTKSLLALSKPWFHSIPDDEGRWQDDKKTDEDVAFWKKFEDEGHALYLANRIVIGHAELMVRLPGKDLQAFYYPMRSFNEKEGWPEETWS